MDDIVFSTDIVSPKCQTMKSYMIVKIFMLINEMNLYFEDRADY